MALPNRNFLNITKNDNESRVKLKTYFFSLLLLLWENSNKLKKFLESMCFEHHQICRITHGCAKKQFTRK